MNTRKNGPEITIPDQDPAKVQVCSTCHASFYGFECPYCTSTMLVTDDQIEDLRQRAIAAGDEELQDICDIALCTVPGLHQRRNGDRSNRAWCRREVARRWAAEVRS